MQPLDAGLLGLKGMVLHQQGQQEDAKVLIDHGLTINPRDPRLHNYLAQVQDALGDSFGAELSFIQAVRLDPHYLEAWWNAGKSMLKHHRAKEAIHALSQAYRLAPNDGEIILDLVEAHFLARDLTKAVSLLGKASRLGYAPEAVRAWLGAVLQGLGRDEEAKNCALVPGLNSDLECQRAAEAMHKIGRAELHLGNLESAEHWLNEAITINPDVAGLYADLVATRKFTDSDESLLVKMKQLLSDSPQGEHRELEFALGKAYADIGQHDLSFSHYLAGNDLVRSKVHFDASAHHEYISQLVEIFSRERLQELPMGSDSNIPILIVGTPRSGTTLTESIISSHSEIAGAGEMEFWSRVKPHWSKVFPKAYTKELAVRLAHEYLMFMRNHSTTAARITDKMPGNFMHLGIIHSVLPKAKLIHIKRHPIDACLSIYFQNFPNGHSYKWDLESLAFWYEQYQRIMAHWRSILPADTLFEFWYEDLVEDTEGVSRQVMEFLGLEWEPGQLDYHKKERAIFTASKWQVRQPIYKSSKERWRKFEKHLGPLLPLLKYSREGA
jgi:Flp pilus assembly protein TadD